MFGLGATTKVAVTVPSAFLVQVGIGEDAGNNVVGVAEIVHATVPKVPLNPEPDTETNVPFVPNAGFNAIRGIMENFTV